MLNKIAEKWWALALRGVAAIIFGILAVAWPSLTVLTLVWMFGAFAFLDGLFAVVVGITSIGANQRWWAMLLAGIGGMIIGLITLFWPGTTAMVLLYLIAAWALVTGVFQIMAAIHLRKVINNEWLAVIGGIAYVLFGVLLVVHPLNGALSLIWVIGIYAIVLGIWMIIFALRLRSLAKKKS